MPITKLCQPAMSVAVSNFSVQTSSLNQSFATCTVPLHFLLAAQTAWRGLPSLRTWHWSNHLVLCAHFNFMPYRGQSLSALNKNWVFSALLFYTIYLLNSLLAFERNRDRKKERSVGTTYPKTWEIQPPNSKAKPPNKIIDVTSQQQHSTEGLFCIPHHQLSEYKKPFVGAKSDWKTQEISYQKTWNLHHNYNH